MDAFSNRVPYRHLKETELELVELNGGGDRRGERDSTSIPISSPSNAYDSPGSSSNCSVSSDSKNPPAVNSSVKILVLGCMVGAGVQFGWALQLSLLTPYIQGIVIRLTVNNENFKNWLINSGFLKFEFALVLMGIGLDVVSMMMVVVMARGYIYMSFPISLVIPFWGLLTSLNCIQLGSMACPALFSGSSFRNNFLGQEFTTNLETLGIEHAFSSFIWLCGPITGLIVQPCVGIWSDKCQLKLGRRRPFILAGCVMISFAVLLIGFAADFGYVLGDTNEDCMTYKGPRWRAAVIFIIGFWMLDLANNTVQGPARALLADLSGPDQRHYANAIFCSWMALGNILGFSAGSSGQWQRWFPFLRTKACCEACANLKAAFLIAVAFLMFCMFVTLYFAKEVPLQAKSAQHSSDSAPLLKDPQQNALGLSQKALRKLENGPESNPNMVHDKANSNGASDFDSRGTHDQSDALNDGSSAVLVKLLTSLRHLPPGMYSVLLVMALTWMSWFPFFLFDTDWMGREVYHGDPKGNPSESDAYQNGVREGAFGLILNSVVLGISSFLIDPMCRRIGSKLVWATSNFVVFICMAVITIISFLSVSNCSGGIQHVLGANKGVKNAALVIFSLLGFPLAVTYSVPFSVTAELTAGTGGGQGLATGVLNLAIVVPQMIVSLGAGPWDALFGGGNIPAFFLASLFSLAGGVVAFLKLPTLSNSYSSSGFHGFG